MGACRRVCSSWRSARPGGFFLSREGAPLIGMGAHEALGEIDKAMRDAFERERRVLSFSDYLELVRAEPTRHIRDASLYIRDMFAYYGETRVQKPFGELTRYRVFDQAFLGLDAKREALVGQERVQAELVRSLQNFVRVGRTNRLLLLHGPNGSAKSTLIACVMRGLEHYSTTDEGALYRYSWVFPKKAQARGTIGFGGTKGRIEGQEDSYAGLSDDELEARVSVEVRDHPLFLLPEKARAELVSRWLPTEYPVPRWISHGTLCDKSKKIFDALLLEAGGSLDRVLRHIRVERYFISRRYRTGAVTLGPELSVDARERQVTMDQNLGALPLGLRGLSLYEVSGELVDSSGGVLELSDLLKRPLDAFKYLQTMIETGEVALSSQTLLVNSLLLASGNELHLAAFREHPEFESFRGRFELCVVPYLLNHEEERSVYEGQVAERAGVHVAPHALGIAARFAVLTRLKRPASSRYPDSVRGAVQELTAWDKMRLYAGALIDKDAQDALPRTLTELKPIARDIHEEYRTQVEYEGSFGASPREMTSMLLDAAQDARFSYLSPFAVLEALDRLCERRDDYGFLRIEPQGPGYHDTLKFRRDLKVWLFDGIEDEFRQVSGLVEETRYGELLGRYFEHLGAQAKNEKVKNPMTHVPEEPDERLMAEVERLLGAEGPREEFRGQTMRRIAAWALDYPGQKLTSSAVFQEMLGRLRSSVFEEKRSELAIFCRALCEPTPPKDPTLAAAVQRGLDKLTTRFGYTEDSARDAARYLTVDRFSK